jgi:hypothetical protein
MERTGREEGISCSSTLAVALRLVHIRCQPDAWALFARDHRPVAFLTPPPRPGLRAKVTAQQKQDDAERKDANEPNNWTSDVQHSQNVDRCCANSCTFKPDGKSGANRSVGPPPICKPGSNLTDSFKGGAGI